MPTTRTRTRLSGWTSIAALGLVAAQVVVLTSIDTPYLVVAATAIMLITAFATFKLCRDNCVESRLVMASVATASAVGVTLSSTIGLPGVARQPFHAQSVALLVTAVLVLLAITVEARRRRGVARPGSPYAL